MSIQLLDEAPSPDLTLDSLADIANREHEQVEQAIDVVRAGVTAGVMHAIRAGEALTAARQHVPDGEWEAWVAANIHYAQATVKIYSRLATYRAEVERWIEEGGQGGILDAFRSLRGLPSVSEAPSRPEWEREVALARHAEGVPVNDIANELGIAWVTVKTWVDPTYKAHRRAERNAAKKRRLAAAKALKQQEQDRAVRKAGGSAADAYAAVRKAAAALDRALSEAGEADEREHLRAAMSSVHRAEDQIVRSMRLGRRIA